MAHRSVTVTVLPACTFCEHFTTVKPGTTTARARYDGATRVDGHWAYMCEEHFAKYGIGLGMGRGQRLTLPGEADGGTT